jgi:D-hexose-6-phosphate mutarotase
MDSVVMPFFCRQRRPPSAPRARLQPWQLHAHAGDADGSAAVVAGLREKLIKIGAKVVSHGRYVAFQLAEVSVSQQMFAEILSLIGRLRAPPAPA